MKVMIPVFIIVFSFMSVTLCRADDTVVKEAYSLYYKGEKEEAIRAMEDYVKDNPDAGVYYFLGYAYYEMQQMERANEYFNKAFRLKNFYSPMPEKESPQQAP